MVQLVGFYSIVAFNATGYVRDIVYPQYVFPFFGNELQTLVMQ